MEDRLDSHALLQQDSDGDGSHAILRAWAVGNVHRVDARILDRLHGLDHRLGVRPFRRNDLDGCHELAVRDLVAPVRARLKRRRLNASRLVAARIAFDDHQGAAG